MIDVLHYKNDAEIFRFIGDVILSYCSRSQQTQSLSCVTMHGQKKNENKWKQTLNSQ